MRTACFVLLLAGCYASPNPVGRSPDPAHRADFRAVNDLLVDRRASCIAQGHEVMMLWNKAVIRFTGIRFMTEPERTAQLAIFHKHLQTKGC